MNLLEMDAILLVRGVVNCKRVTLLELTVEHLLVVEMEVVDGSSSITTYKSSDSQHDNPEYSGSKDENWMNLLPPQLARSVSAFVIKHLQNLLGHRLHWILNGPMHISI
jgi:hypothetical protein